LVALGTPGYHLFNLPMYTGYLLFILLIRTNYYSSIFINYHSSICINYYLSICINCYLFISSNNYFIISEIILEG
ncbi:MAG TPA: hypothetical protein VFV08_04205, partial [Puia sp.]|nr:hypothetical protein [Puia sp.]